MATTTTTVEQHNQTQADLTKLEQFVATKFCWDDLDEAQRHNCVAYEDGPRLQFKTLMGTKYGWDVAGPVQMFWNDVLCPRLQHHYRNNRDYILKDTYWDGNTKCLMIGTTTKRSKPAVLIMSEDKGVAKRFARIIKRDDRFQASCFDLLASNSNLEFRAGNERSLSGMPIMVDLANSKQRFATLGGSILVGGIPFGLTVAHLFFNSLTKKSVQSVNKTLQPVDKNELYDLMEDSLDEEDEPFQPPKNNDLNNRGRKLFPTKESRRFVDVHNASSEEYVGYTLLGRDSKYIGYNCLDWALINLKADPERYLNEHYTANGTQKLSIRNVLTVPPISDVLVCSNLTNAKATRLSRTKTLISLPQSSAGLETAYTINGVRDRGECGSWVIDSSTGDAFGVLVAVSVFEKLSFVVPLCDVLNRIKSVWKNSVELLTKSKLEEKHHSLLHEQNKPAITSRLAKSSLRLSKGDQFASQAPAADAQPESGTMLWMIEIEPWLDENFIRSVWSSLGEHVNVKFIQDSSSRRNAKYCSIEFQTPAAAAKALTLNGTLIPSANIPFKLEWPFAKGTKAISSRNDEGLEYRIFVGDLGPEVNDSVLLAVFQNRFLHCKSAKIIRAPLTRISRGYGFVYFSDENEHERALREMQGIYCGNRPMRISAATPKSPRKMSMQHRVGPMARELTGVFLETYRYSQQINQLTNSNNNTVFVDDLSSYIREDELRSFFQGFGEIAYVKIAPGKGYGFVQFVQRRAAEMAMNQIQGYPIGNSLIRFSWGRIQNSSESTDRPHKPTPQSPIDRKRKNMLSQPQGSFDFAKFI